MMSLTFGLFTQVSGSGPLGPLVYEHLGPAYTNGRQILDELTDVYDALSRTPIKYWVVELNHGHSYPVAVISDTISEFLVD